MNEFNELIKLAIEGGYKEPRLNPPIIDTPIEVIVLDPLFHRAIGKALGWRKKAAIGFIPEYNQFALEHQINQRAIICDEWKYHAHQAFDLLMDGGDINQWARELLKKKV